MGISRFYTQTASIQRSVTTDDGAGYRSSEWLVLLTVKGSLDMLTGSRVYMAQSELSKYTHVFICATLPLQVTPKDRIVIGDAIYNIVNVDNPVSMGHHVEILLTYNSLVNENSQEQQELDFHNLYMTTVQ